MHQVRPHQLLVTQEQKACGAQNRTQEVLPLVPRAHQAQGGQKIVAQWPLLGYTQAHRALSLVVEQRSPKPPVGVRFPQRPHPMKIAALVAAVFIHDSFRTALEEAVAHRSATLASENQWMFLLRFQ